MGQADDEGARVEELAGTVLDIEAEREVSGTVSAARDQVAEARAHLHEWVDSVVGVVAIAGSGRVTLIHADGAQSGIASAPLAYKLTPPVRFNAGE